VQARFAARQDEKQSYADLIQRAGQIRADYQAWQSVREALHTQAAQAERYRQLERQRLELDSEVAAEGARLQQEAASLKARALEVQNQQRRLPDLLGQFKAAQQAFTQAEMDLKKKAKLEEEYTLARQKWPKLKADNQRLQAEMEEIKAHILQLGQGSEGVCPTCGQKLTQADCERLLESLEAQGKDKGNLYRANKALLDQAEQVERALMQQIQALSSAQAMALAQGRVVEQAAAQIRQIEEQIVGWEKIEAPRLAEIERGLERQDYCPEARQRLAQVEEQTRALGYDPAAHEALRQQETAGQRAELELRELEKAQGMLGAAERDLADLEKQLATSQADVKTQEDDHRTAAAILAEAESLAPDVELAQRQLDGWRERENQLRMEVGAAQQKVDVLEDQRKRHRILEGALEMQNVQISRYKQLERAFGRDGVPALLIEQALPQIEARANLILDRLSAGGMAVRFVTQAAYKDKRREDLRETLEIQISDGSGTRDYEMYSGGEAFRVNFAIRLALSEVLAQRAGARLQMLVIDEGFGSQDALGRQRLVEAINLVKGDFAKILVITHIEELKDHFPNRIEVEKTPLGSQVRVL
jgi:exonuclease SbcC